VEGDEEGFLSDGSFVIEGRVLINRGISGFDRVHLFLFNLVLVWLVGNLVWGLMVMSVLLFIR
jgi:hypothetical protein